jgi:hypothetical protein
LEWRSLGWRSFFDAEIEIGTEKIARFKRATDDLFGGSLAGGN